MTLSERCLHRLCRPTTSVRKAGEVYGSVDEAREELLRHFDISGVERWVRGRRVLDFGCGYGFHLKAMLDLGASHVTGVDIQEDLLQNARGLLGDDPRSRLVNSQAEPDWGKGVRFDTILSMNSMEHIENPAGWMRQWSDWLEPSGAVLVAFGPLWWSPYGAHMGFITPVPWVHMMFRESTVMKVRSRYRDDGATRYEEIEGGMNRMSRRKFHRCVSEAGLKLAWVRYYTVRSLPLVGSIPGVREMFTQGMAAALVKQ